MRSVFIVGAFALVAVAIAACGAGNPGGPTEQGIEGRYTISGPGNIQDCSELPAGDEMDACEAANQPWTRPMTGEQVEVRDDDQRFVARTITDGDGAFRVPLPPGEYLVCTLSCEGPLTVQPGEFTFYELRLAVP